MYHLNTHSCFNEVIAYCMLCHEYRIKTVKVDRETRKHIGRLIGTVAAHNGNVLGVEFRVKTI